NPILVGRLVEEEEIHVQLQGHVSVHQKGQVAQDRLPLTDEGSIREALQSEFIRAGAILQFAQQPLQRLRQDEDDVWANFRVGQLGQQLAELSE
ncbi:hypothetical protein HK405_015028, partial [Cladochytrium tenue]